MLPHKKNLHDFLLFVVTVDILHSKRAVCQILDLTTTRLKNDESDNWLPKVRIYRKRGSFSLRSSYLNTKSPPADLVEQPRETPGL